MRVQTPARWRVRLSIHDLATGLLAHEPREMREWASMIVALSNISFIGIEDPDGEVLLDALWAAADGKKPSPESLEVARRLAN